MNDIKEWCKDPERLKEYEISIRKATEQNRKDNSFLSTSDFVPEDLWNRITEAIGYDSATTVEWAVKKLSILYRRIQSVERIFVPGINVYLEKNNFEEVISKTFSCSLFNEILKVKTASGHNKRVL